MKKRYDYHPDDEPYAPFHFYYDLLVVASRNGYCSYKSAVLGLYAREKMVTKVAKIFGITKQAMCRAMNKFEVQRLPTTKGQRRAPVQIGECKRHGKTAFYVRSEKCRQCQYEANERNARREFQRAVND